MWPDYLTRETLAKRLDLSVNALEQYVKQGRLPPPVYIGDALRWRWETVDSFLTVGKVAEASSGDAISEALRAAKDRTSSARPVRPLERT